MINESMQTNRPKVIIGLLVAIVLAAIEVTIVSTAMPTIVRELGLLIGYPGIGYFL